MFLRFWFHLLLFFSGNTSTTIVSVFCKTARRFTIFWDAARYYMSLFCISRCSVHRLLWSALVTERRAIHVSVSSSKSFLCISAEVVIHTALFSAAIEFLLILTKSKSTLSSQNWHRFLKVNQLSPCLLFSRAAFLQILWYHTKHALLHWFSYLWIETCDGNLTWLM